MSSNRTAFCQLHLWEPEDDFLRTEFNENNQAIDSALSEAALHRAELGDLILCRKLMDVTTTETVRQVTLDVSSIDFLSYMDIRVHYFIPTGVSGICAVRFNNRSGTSDYCVTYITSGSDYDDDYAGYVPLNPPCAGVFQLTNPISGGEVGCTIMLSTTNSTCAFTGAAKLTTAAWGTNLTSINLYHDSSATGFGAGSRFIITGVKK